MTDPPYILALERVTKRYPSALSLDNLSFGLGKGEVLAVLGESGSGKSSLARLLAGLDQPDDGEIHVDGRCVQIRGPRRSRSLGVAVAHRDLDLIAELDVSANIHLGQEPRRFGLRDGQRADALTRDLLDQVGAEIEPSTLVADLAASDRQLVALARALAQGPTLLVLDEPSACLDDEQVQRLYDLVRKFATEGMGVLYMTSSVAEAERVASRAIVMRDGRIVRELDKEELNRDAVQRAMVGRDLVRRGPRRKVTPGRVRLEASGLVLPAHPESSLFFEARAGEVLGIAGRVGSGCRELLRKLCGFESAIEGELRLDGKPLRSDNPREAIRRGVAFVPSRRGSEGLFSELGLRENLGIASLGRRSRKGLVRPDLETGLGQAMIADLRLGTPWPDETVAQLSGSDQQKILIGRYLPLRPSVLLVDEPTRGVDMRTRSEIFTLLHNLAGDGVAVIFASHEIEEVLALADRVLILGEDGFSEELGDGRADSTTMTSLIVADEPSSPLLPGGEPTRPAPENVAEAGTGK